MGQWISMVIRLLQGAHIGAKNTTLPPYLHTRGWNPGHVVLIIAGSIDVSSATEWVLNDRVECKNCPSVARASCESVAATANTGAALVKGTVKMSRGRLLNTRDRTTMHIFIYFYIPLDKRTGPAHGSLSTGGLTD
jgi:hypothetical protein